MIFFNEANLLEIHINGQLVNELTVLVSSNTFFRRLSQLEGNGVQRYLN